MTKALSKTSTLLQQFILALFVAKVNVEILNKRSNTKQLLTSISVAISIYQPLNVIFTSASGLCKYHVFELINLYVNLIEVNNCILLHSSDATDWKLFLGNLQRYLSGSLYILCVSLVKPLLEESSQPVSTHTLCFVLHLDT